MMQLVVLQLMWFPKTQRYAWLSTGNFCYDDGFVLNSSLSAIQVSNFPEPKRHPHILGLDADACLFVHLSYRCFHDGFAKLYTPTRKLPGHWEIRIGCVAST